MRMHLTAEHEWRRNILNIFENKLYSLVMWNALYMWFTVHSCEFCF